MKFGIGQPLTRKEDNKFITGNGSYTDDLNFANQIYMYILRSPFAHAKIKDINFSEALKVKGVLEVIDYQTINLP